MSQIETQGLLDMNSKAFKDQAYDILARAAGQAEYTQDQGVAFHKDPPNQISIPVNTTVAQAAKRLAETAADEEQTKSFVRTFKYRPWDGAYAMINVMKEVFGTAGKSMPIRSMFGSQPPQMIEVDISATETVSIPWGQTEFSLFEGVINTGYTRDPEYGMLFQLSIDAPKKFELLIQGFFQLIEARLRMHSIYKGKAVEAITDRHGMDSMKFLSIREDSTIIYNETVERQLYNVLWGVVENSGLVKSDNRKVNNRVLLWGPYGTGKSECGNRTAALCEREGWTFILFRSGSSGLDDLEKVIKTARLYQPAVVMIEDVDVYTSNTDPSYSSRLSNIFDGIQSKRDEVMLLMTSNRPAEFNKSMLRAGRIDAMIEIGALDREATERMIRSVVGDHRLSDTVDFDRVWTAVEHFEPAFVRQTFEKAATAALLRTKSRDYVLDTEDFEVAADLIRPQHELHSSKSDKRQQVSLEDIIGNAVVKAFTERAVLDVELHGDVDVSGQGEYSVREFANQS